jgi:hypothetical protein
MFLPSPTEAEVTAIKNGPAEFALAVESGVIFLLYQFEGGLPWSDAPYQWWLNSPEMRSLPNPEPIETERALLHIVLVDADTGIIMTLRTLTFSPEFSARLHGAIRQQSRSKWLGADAYEKSLASLYRKFPTTEDLLARATARCTGGD